MRMKDYGDGMVSGETVLEQAIAWHLRLREADGAGWEAFAAWLEQSPTHASEYDRVAITDALLPEAERLAAVALPADDSANDNLPVPARGWRWLAGGASMAAAIAAVLVVPGLVRPADPLVYQTRDGAPRSVTLSDGSRIDLGGGSRLVVDASAPRLARLERGEALFHVQHNADRPFTVQTGDVAVRDLGTVFSVAHDRDAVRVAVAEGSVAVSRDQRQLTLGPGQTAVATAAADDLTQGRIEPAAVGSWRSRTLTFQGEPLAAVIDRLNRLYALHITLAPNLSDRPFTGMVRLTGDAVRDGPHLAALIGTTWQRDGEGWRLSGAQQR